MIYAGYTGFNYLFSDDSIPSEKVVQEPTPKIIKKEERKNHEVDLVSEARNIKKDEAERRKKLERKCVDDYSKDIYSIETCLEAAHLGSSTAQLYSAVNYFELSEKDESLAKQGIYWILISKDKNKISNEIFEDYIKKGEIPNSFDELLEESFVSRHKGKIVGGLIVIGATAWCYLDSSNCASLMEKGREIASNTANVVINNTVLISDFGLKYGKKLVLPAIKKMVTFFKGSYSKRLAKKIAKSFFRAIEKRRKLPPNKTFYNNGFKFTTDQLGRPSKAGGFVKFGKSMRNSKLTSKIGNLGLKKDQGGHLIADKLGGTSRGFNLAPMSRKVNLSSIKKLENLAVKLAKKGRKIYVENEAKYLSDSIRPHKFLYKICIERKTNCFKKTIFNTPD